MEEFEGKVAVVTGGASGIGSGMCRRFAGAGMGVVVADLDEDGAEGLSGELRSGGARSIAVQTDVADLASVERLAAVALEEMGSVDLVCNNAGVFIGGSIREITRDDWRWVMSVNLDGVFHGCKVFVPILLQGGRGGHIVNTSSVGGFLTAPMAAVYSATKFAVVAYSEALRTDLEPDGIGVSILCPGPIRTKLAECDKHRPSDLPSAGNHSGVLWDMIRDGLDPIEVGEIVLRGVRANAPYIFTHPEWRDALEERFERVLAGFDPPGPVLSNGG